MTAVAETVPGTRSHRRAVRQQAKRLVAAISRGAMPAETLHALADALLELPTLHVVRLCVDHFLAGRQIPIPAEIYAWERARQAAQANPQHCPRCDGTGFVEAPDIYHRRGDGSVHQILAAVRPCPACKGPIRP